MAMPGEANVKSVDAIERFRAALLVYAAKAKPLLDDANDEVARTREWLRTDRRMHWENEVRRRKRILDQAEQSYFSARFSTLRDATAAEQMAVQRARHAVTEAEEKLARVRKWSSVFDDRTGPPLKQLEQLRTLIATDLAKAAIVLDRTVKTLSAYAETGPVAAAPTPEPDSGEEPIPGEDRPREEPS